MIRHQSRSFRSHAQKQAFGFQAPANTLKLNVHNALEFLRREPVKDDDFINAVQEFRTEVAAQRLQGLGFPLFRIGFIEDILAADVGGHDDDRVAEVNRTSLAVRNAAVVQYLEQYVKDVRVGLFNFIEENHAVRTAPHGFRELTAFFIPHVSGRRPDEARNGMFFHVFGHVNADDGVFIVKKEFRQRLAELRLADAGGSQEQERANGPVFILQPGAGASHSVGYGLNGLFLPDYAGAQAFFHVHQLGTLPFLETGSGNAGPGGNHFGDVSFRDFLLQQPSIFLLHFTELFLAFRQGALGLRKFSIGDFRCAGQITHPFGPFTFQLEGFYFFLFPADGVQHFLFTFPFGNHGTGFFLQIGQVLGDFFQTRLAVGVFFLRQRLPLHFKLHGFTFNLVNFRGHGVQLNFEAGCRFIHQVYCLVRQKTVGNITVGKGGGRHDGSVRNTHSMVNFIAFFQAAQDGNGIFHAGLGDHDGLKPAFQSRILFNVFAVFVQCRRADGPQFPAGQGGFEQVGRIHRPFTGARAYDGVQLINK